MEDTKSGAASILLPAALIRAMVACIRPEPMKPLPIRPVEQLGFSSRPMILLQILSIIHWIKNKEFLKLKTFYGNEIVAKTPPYGIDEPFSTTGFWERRLYLQPMPWFQTVACG